MRGVRGPGHRPLTRGACHAAAVAIALLLGACGGSDDGPRKPDPAARPATLPANFNINQFSCADWRRADEPTRRYVIRELRNIAKGQVTGTGVRGRGPALPDDQAYRLFESYCRERYAQAFILYKLYGHAAAFTGTPP